MNTTLLAPIIGMNTKLLAPILGSNTTLLAPILGINTTLLAPTLDTDTDRERLIQTDTLGTNITLLEVQGAMRPSF